MWPKSSARTRQFTLRGLMAAIALIAVICGAVVPLTIIAETLGIVMAPWLEWCQWNGFILCFTLALVLPPSLVMTSVFVFKTIEGRKR